MSDEELTPRKRMGRPPGGVGTVNREIDYSCTCCGAEVGRENLTVKRAFFTTMGKPPTTIKSRTVAWLCQPCLDKDPDWTLDKFVASPGMRGTKIATEED
jgi:hypothetical protein